MMLGIERFIASAIRLVRIVPEAPTIIPATISAVLFSAIPVAAADRPVNALSSEITTGMSAPPIGSTRKLPSRAAATSTPTMRALVVLARRRWPPHSAIAHQEEQQVEQPAGRAPA